MPDLINKLSTYAALLGVIMAIGGGFYTWGTFNQRLDVIEKNVIKIEKKKVVVNKPVDLSGINKEIKELHEKINERSNLLGVAQDKDYEGLNKSISELSETIEKINGDVRINKATIDYVDAKIEELKVKQSNPLLN